MKQGYFIALIILLVSGFGCKQVSKSLTVSRDAVEEFHRKDAQGLCDRFSAEMLESMPCDSMARIMRQTVDEVGEPTGTCRWYYTYQIIKLNPFRTVTVYRCPFEKEPVKVTVVVDVGTDEGTVVSGLWADSPRIRKQRLLVRVELCREVDKNTLRCVQPVTRAEWTQPWIIVWTEWQGLKKGDQLRMEWHSPQDEPLDNFEHEVKSHSSKSYMFWSWIEPKEVNNIDEPYGTWTVLISVNSRDVEIFPVEVIP
jgi:hypothetical protein